MSKITVKNSKMKRQNQRKSRHLLKVLIWLLTTAMFQWGCGQIPEEGTIVYDVDFPPADSDEAQGGGSGGGSDGSTPQNIILNASKTTLNELGSDTLTISATSDATSTTNIIVSVGYSGTATRGSDYSASADNLTILAGGTTSNSITITSRDDGIYDDGETIDVDISSVSGGDSAVESGTQQKTIVFSDDELPPAVTPPVVSISASADSITEDSGGTIIITVEQDVVASIATTVTLTLTGTATNTTDYNLSSTTATIAAGTLQDNLTLTPTTDSITEDNETVLISIASVSGGDNASEDGVQIAEVTITDDEPLRTVTLGFDTTSVNENAGSGAITITATQSGQAQADTIVNLGVSGDALASGTDYTLNSSFITIAGGTTTGTTTIDIVNDVIDEGDNETFALEISSVTGGNGASESGTQSVTAMILDNDVAGFTQVGPTDPVGVYYSNPLYLNEGDNETFTIVLNTQPQGTVYFDITGSGGGACGSDAYYDCYALADGSQILTFDETNWNIAQSVVTLAKDDNSKRSDQRKYTYVTPSASSADPYYAALSPDIRNYIFVDTDTVGVTVSKTTSTINESGAGSTDTFTVGLDTVPLYQTYLSVTSDNTSEVTVSPSSLAYHSSYPFGFTRTVTVTGVSDDIDDGDQTVNVSIAVNTGLTSDQFYDNYTTVRTVAVTISDVDTAAFTVSESGGVSSVSESGSTDTFEVALLTKPRSGNVVIDLTSADPAEVTVSPASISFGSGNWSTAQVITLTGQPDSAADGDQTVSIRASVRDNATADTVYQGLADQNFNVTVADTDQAGLTVSSPGAVTEIGSFDNFTIVLNTGPTSAVVVDISSSDTGEVTVSPASLSFSTGNWSIAQTVIVTGINDNVSDGDQNSNIIVGVDNSTSDPNYAALSDINVGVTTLDDDDAGFSLGSTAGLSVNESGTTDTFTVVLDTEPTADVVFAITSENTAEAIVSSSLTFTSANWNTPQSVTITGVDDPLDDNDQTVSITVAINTTSTLDVLYDTLASQSTNVTVVDDEVAPLVTLSASSTTVTEDSGTITLTATQTFATASDTTVTLTGTGGTASGSDYTVGTITILAGDTTGTTSFTPDRDKVDENDETATVEITSVSSAAGATEDGTQSVIITINDDDTAELKYSHIGGSTSVTEGGSTDSLTLYLGSEPTGNVVVEITYTEQSQVEVTTPSSLQLTFTPANYMNTQVITLRAIDDDFIDGNHTSTVTISVNAGLTADSNYDGLSSKNKTVSIIDDDTSGIADFTIDSIDRDYGRLALNWTAPSGIVNDGDTTSVGGSDDYYRVYWTTVAPGARTPANRDIDQTDNATRTIDADRILFVHGGLNSATYYYYRLAVYDTSTGAWKFSTNELGASPLPVECTSTGGTSEITDNDPDLLVYYPLNNDLQDHSPQRTRTGAEGWPYHLAEASSDSDIDFGEGCAYGNSAYMSGSGAYDGNRGNGTWGVNNDFSNADFPANDGNWTVSVWTSPDGDLEKFTSIFSTGDNNKGPELQLDVDDKYEPIGRIRLFNKMSDNLKGQQLRQSTWYHVVVVHHADDSVELYVNNVLKDTETNWPYTSGGNLQWDKIKIGQNRYRDANYKGYIDEFKIYGRAFTASDVANLYNFTLPPAVENINVSGQGGSTLRLTWDEVDGAIDYTIFQAEKSSSGLTNVITFTNPNLDTSTDPDLSAIPGITSCTSGSCSYDVTGLTNNKYYYYRIAARNGRGSGQVSPNSEVSAQCCSP